MKISLAFDVYGTLIDTGGVYDALQKKVGDKAKAFMETWRSKQLEYSFRRGLMQNYADFSVCTRNALDFACLQLNCNLSEEDKNELMSQYNILPAFGDVEESLVKLKAANCRLFAFSNGSAAAVKNLLQNAGIDHFFEAIVSVEAVKTFKPNPAVYDYFLQKTNTAKTNAWLISGNPFDVIGSISAGFRSVWVQRNPTAIFDPWEIKPTKIIRELNDLIKVLELE
ncbi:MAG: haloacid dehalogenase type II [Bacteroidetes bacterium HGW-Bacteroidetes-3]|jgi:2-haloacid dehalogenase|nr:MAG: haloacid dehalogenase type II [Bacteroidetes bacterium HGW-Bacteroidetes-3]